MSALAPAVARLLGEGRHLPAPPPGTLPLDGWRDALPAGPTVLLALSAALVTAAALAAWVLAGRRRRTGIPRRDAWRTSLAEVGLVCGTLPWAWVTLAPGPRAGQVAGRVSLVPLRDLATMSSLQVVGNLLVLAVVGLLAPVRFPALRSVGRVALLAAAVSVSIETAQYALRLDRVSSVDDVLLNTVGAGLAALLSRPWWPAGAGSGAEAAAPATT